jgi:hypothetical protein
MDLRWVFALITNNKTYWIDDIVEKTRFCIIIFRNFWTFEKHFFSKHFCKINCVHSFQVRDVIIFVQFKYQSEIFCWNFDKDWFILSTGGNF